jgi:hypothetical protein
MGQHEGDLRHLICTLLSVLCTLRVITGNPTERDRCYCGLVCASRTHRRQISMGSVGIVSVGAQSPSQNVIESSKMTQDGMDAEVDTGESQWMERKLTLYHEAAHAVFMWNFGFEVERVMVGQSGLSGYVAPAHYWSDGCATTKRLAVILSGLAGGVAHRCFQTGEAKDKL